MDNVQLTSVLFAVFSWSLTNGERFQPHECWTATFNKCMFGKIYKPCYELKYTWDNEYECKKFMEYHDLGQKYFDPFDTEPEIKGWRNDPHHFDDVIANPGWDTVTPRDHDRDLDPPWFPENAEKFAEQWHGITDWTTTRKPTLRPTKSLFWWLEGTNLEDVTPNINRPSGWIHKDWRITTKRPQSPVGPTNTVASTDRKPESPVGPPTTVASTNRKSATTRKSTTNQ